MRAETSRGWEVWYAILDAGGATAKGHTQSARYLREEHDPSPRWARTISIRYEWEMGLRKEGRN